MAHGTFYPHLCHDNTSRSHYYTKYTYTALCNAFPSSARAPIKPYISLPTIALINDRNRTRALYKHVRLNPHNSWWLPSLDFLAKQFKEKAKEARRSVCRDFKNWTASRCSEAQAAHDKGDQRAFFQIKRSLCHKPSPTPTCVMDDNTPCVYYKDIRLAFQKYFSNLLQGETKPVAKAMQDIFFSIKQCGKLDIPIPTAAQLFDITRNCKPFTAPGPDGIKYIVLQHFPWLIQTFYPIYLDACTNLPPSQWSASILHELLKKHGESTCLSNYRDVLLCDVVGKVFKRYFRSCMLPFLETYILESMCGGFLRRGVDFCSHYLRAVMTLAKATKQSCATLFLDVKTAFASVIRELIYRGRISDESVMKAFHRLGFAPAVFAQFKATLQGPSAMEDAKVPPNLTNAFASFIGNSYFHTKGVDNVVVYDSGTGAGNPLADLAFAFLAARVLIEADKQIIAANLQVDIPSTPLSIVSPSPLGYGNFTGASYVDDTFFACIDKNPATCLDKICQVCSIVIDVFSCHGLTLNFKYGKTGFLLQLRGSKALSIIRNIEGSPPTLVVPSKALGLTEVYVYSDYKHVGSFANTACSFSQEVGMRCNAGRAARKDIARMCRSNKLLTSSKIHLTHSFGASALFSNIASIPFWPKGSLDRITKVYDSLYRAATISRHSQTEVPHEHTLGLFKKHSIALCSNKIVTVRLRYLRRVLLHAPTLLKKMIAYEWSIPSKITWCELIKSDLAYMQSISPFLDHFPDPRTSPEVWFTFITTCPKDYFCCTDRILFEFPGHTDVYNLPPVPVVKDKGPNNFACGICELAFTSHQEASAHRFKKHGVKSTLRAKILLTHCLYCCKEFHTRTKVHNHIAYRSKLCASYYNHAIKDLDETLIAKLEKEETARVKSIVAQGHSKLYHPLPCVRIIGPVPPPPISVDTHFLSA